MKKHLRWIILVIALAFAGILSIPLINLAIGAPTATALTQRARDHTEAQRVAEVLQRSCANCHTTDTRLPWYGSLPGAASLVSEDIEQGRRYFNLPSGLFPEDDGPATEPTLARIEWVIEQGSMPPSPYKYAHWESRIGDDERAEILGWVRTTRIRHYGQEGLDEEVLSRAVHPLTKGPEVDARRAALGETLYFDARLSGDETLSCASCHDLTKGGTDQERVSTGIRDQRGGINAPTTYNAFHNLAQFWDGRAANLEEQAAGPPLNPIEMGSSWEQIIPRLTSDPALSARFAEAYPGGDPVTAENIMDAIAEYERTLVTPDAPFDRYLLGQGDALDDDALRGWDRFQDRGCQTCHVGRTLGGQSYELMGRAHDYFAERGGELTDADQGRFSVTEDEADMHRFKVPILRNVALTFPYFHDGSTEDLADAVRTMGHVQFGNDLSADEVSAIVAFLESLTGTFQGQPLAEAPTEARAFPAPESETVAPDGGVEQAMDGGVESDGEASPSTSDNDE